MLPISCNQEDDTGFRVAKDKEPISMVIGKPEWPEGQFIKEEDEKKVK